MPEKIARKVMVVAVVAVVEFVPPAQITQWVAAVAASARTDMIAEVAVTVRSGQIETTAAAAVAVAATVYSAQKIQCFAEPAGSVVFGQISSFQPGFGFVCWH